jgi:hypothetical protein
MREKPGNLSSINWLIRKTNWRSSFKANNLLKKFFKIILKRSSNC